MSTEYNLLNRFEPDNDLQNPIQKRQPTDTITAWLKKS